MPEESSPATPQAIADDLKRRGVVPGAAVQVTSSAGKIFIGTVEHILVGKNRITIKWVDASKSRWSLHFALDCLEGKADFKLLVI